MSNLRVRWAFLLLLLVVFAWKLVPTIRYYSLPASEKQSQEPGVAGLRQDSMKLGLDLQGGSYLVYEVALDQINPEDLVGNEVERAIEIIRNRVDQFGVSEPVIQRQGDNRIVIQLPGLQDPERAKGLVGRTARLDFRLVKTREELFQALGVIDQASVRLDMAEIDSVLGVQDQVAADTALAALGDTSLASADTSLAGSDTTLAAAEAAPTDNPFSGLFIQAGTDAGYAFCPAQNLDRAEAILSQIVGNPGEGEDLRPVAGNTLLLWGDKTFGDASGNAGRYLYALTARSDLSGDNVDEAEVSFNVEPTRPNAAGVLLNFDKRGAGIFTKLTGNNVGRQLAIVLDDKVQSAPVIRDKIRGGRASITGLDNDEEAKDLAIVLQAGALPTDLIAQEERTVGPTLGRDSIQQGVRASMVGGILVILLMAVYYRASGLLAVLALVLNLFFLFSTLSMLRGTLTLPGIAGIVLTIGMAVDANVLVLERIREELRTGKTVRGAIDAGYSTAIRTILDANITTLISAIVLSQFGTGPIKGFATTLMIGIVANVFTAVYVTKLIYDSIGARRPIRKLSI